MEKKVRRMLGLILTLVMFISTFAEHQFVVMAAGTPELKPLPSLTGNSRQDVVSIAKSQVGYKEGGVNLNAYGRAMGNNGQAWCVYFVLWCLDQAGVKERPVSGNTCNNVTWFQKNGSWHNQQSQGWKSGTNTCDGVVEDYIPQVGDVVAIENDGAPSEGPDHTAIVVAVDDSWVYTVEGNISNSVSERKYSMANGKLNGKSSSVYVNGYGSINYDETIPLGEMTEKKFTAATTATDGNATKTDSFTTVESKLLITTQPTDAAVTEEAQAVFKIAAEGSSDLTYQWQYKNATGDYWDNSIMPGAKTSSITVKGTTVRNGYQYRCVVKDGSGNKVVSNAAKLGVTKKVQIENQPETQIVMEDGSATFHVKAVGNNLSYQWQYKNAIDDCWYDSTMSGSDTESITVKAKTTRNGYQYRCVVVDSGGNKVVSNAAVLVVVQRIKITAQPAGQTVAAGNKATFHVTASGSGLTYQWQFKSASATYWSDSSMAGNKTNSIAVEASSARNGYQYRCVIKDSNGKKEISDAAKLTVK